MAKRAQMCIVKRLAIWLALLPAIASADPSPPPWLAVCTARMHRAHIDMVLFAATQNPPIVLEGFALRTDGDTLILEVPGQGSACGRFASSVLVAGQRGRAHAWNEQDFGGVKGAMCKDDTDVQAERATPTRIGRVTVRRSMFDPLAKRALEIFKLAADDCLR